MRPELTADVSLLTRLAGAGKGGGGSQAPTCQLWAGFLEPTWAFLAPSIYPSQKAPHIGERPSTKTEDPSSHALRGLLSIMGVIFCLVVPGLLAIARASF